MKTKKTTSRAASKGNPRTPARPASETKIGRKSKEPLSDKSTKNAAKKPIVKGVAAKRNGVAPHHANGSNGATNGKSRTMNGRHAGTNGAGARTAKAADKLIKVKNPQKAIKLPANYRPSDAEPFMGARQQLYFRQRLMNWKDEIVRQAKQTLQSLHEESAQHADFADRATSESDKALELRARDRQRKLIAKIDAALERLDNGTYGYCEETGEPIGLRRLDARPIATLSIEAQERHERRERVHRDD
ncbi:MAG: RNA polymerase-binding protein DksA [Hyphomicrobiaceae bacterium]|nr:MAG: RNA polymerase-binding protein DksA [Hyphomicrobiaceae bacterium]